MFLGRHERGLDSKGRLILPAAHRDALGDDSAIVTYGLDHCLFVFPSTQFEVWRQKIRDLPLTDPLGRLLRRHIFSAADEVTPDGQGRINLLPHLRTYAGLDGQVIIAGMDNYIENLERPALGRDGGHLYRQRRQRRRLGSARHLAYVTPCPRPAISPFFTKRF